MREEELKYALALTRLRGVSQNAALKLYDHYETAQGVFENRKEVQGKVGEALADWTEVLHWAEKELEFCEKNRIKVFLRHDEDYPARLNECDDAPLVFYYRGNANLNARHVISIVGTRRITEYGRTICQTFLRDLQALSPECLVISGLAYGVDIHAHRACLEAGLPNGRYFGPRFGPYLPGFAPNDGGTDAQPRRTAHGVPNDDDSRQGKLHPT